MIFRVGIGASHAGWLVLRQFIRNVITPLGIRGEIAVDHSTFTMDGPYPGKFRAGNMAIAMSRSTSVAAGRIDTIVATR